MSEAPSGHPAVNIGISIALVVASALFVGGEYALVAMRRGRIEPLARKGNKSAKRLLRILDDMSPFIAGTQVGITIVGNFVAPVDNIPFNQEYPFLCM